MDSCATEVYQGWSLNRSVCSEGAKSHSNTILSEDIQIILSGLLLQEDSCYDPTLTAVEWVKKTFSTLPYSRLKYHPVYPPELPGFLSWVTTHAKEFGNRSLGDCCPKLSTAAVHVQPIWHA